MAGSLAASLAWIWKEEKSAFAENMRHAEARILNLEDSGGDLRVRVSYQNEAGVPFEQTFQVARAGEAELRSAGKISVVYDHRDPRIAVPGHVVSISWEMHLANAATGAGLLLALSGTFAVGAQAREVARIERLFREGQSVETEVRGAKMAPGRAYGRFTYAFRGPNGRWYEGKSPEMPAAMLADWPAGRRIRVVFDVENPRNTEPDIFGMLPG